MAAKRTPSIVVVEPANQKADIHKNSDVAKKGRGVDSVSEYVNQAANGHKWNEHEYYMKAKGDMEKQHRSKITKVRKPLYGCAPLVLITMIL